MPNVSDSVVHDLANLLTVVVGRSHLALRSLPADHPARAHVEEVRAAAERAAALLDPDAGSRQGSKR